MPLDKALEELEKYAKDLSSIGDAKQFMKANKEAFISKWAKVNQYYLYIMNNTQGMSDEFFRAIEIVSDISYNNPSLEEWVEMITKPVNSKTQTEDALAFKGSIEALISEVRDMRYWDTQNVSEIKWELEEYLKKLKENRNLFEFYEYQGLLNNINATLDKIGMFEEMVNSNLMQGIRRM